MRAAILSRLTGDAVLMGLLPGGLHDGAVVGEITPRRTPAAFDANKELRPCGLLRLPLEAPLRPFPTGAQLTATIYLYQRRGTDQIEPARRRVYQLLHRQRLQPATGGAWQLEYAGGVLDGVDDALEGGASLIIARYTIPITKG